MSIPRGPIAELVGQLAGVQAVWADDDYGQLGTDDGPEAWIKLTPHTIAQKGQAEYRTTTSDNNPLAYKARVYAYDLAIVTLRAESMDRDVQAYELLRSVRWGLRTMTAKAVYQAHRLAFVRTAPIVCSSAGPASRTRLVAIMDWTFACLGGGPARDDDGQTIGQVNSGGPIPFTPR